MEKDTKLMITTLSIPLLMTISMALFNVYSHNDRVKGLQISNRQCLREFENLTMVQRNVKCSDSLCEISYSNPELVDIKREQCISISEKLEKATNNRDSLILFKIIP